ncbi:uncharacterized protein METZ01_LOCUS438997, partial [marine metagenome]
VEFSDNLPNVKYRIDNRWLFSDISDELEPEVIEINFNNEKVLRKKLRNFNFLNNPTVNTLINNRDINEIDQNNVFIYNPITRVSERSWKNIIIDNANRESFLKIFNQLSYTPKDWTTYRNTDAIFENYTNSDLDAIGLKKPTLKTDFKEALLNAYNRKKDKEKVESIKYLILNYNEQYPEGLEEFLSDCFNADQILEDYDTMHSSSEAIVKFPILYDEQLEAIYVKKNQLQFFNDAYKAYAEFFNNQSNQKVIESKVKEYIA